MNAVDSRCRLCAEIGIEMVRIFEDMKYIDLPTRIQQLFQVKIVLEDNLPTTVCALCCEMVEKTWDFNERVQKAQDLLSGLLTAPSLPISLEFEEDVKYSDCIVQQNGELLEKHEEEENLRLLEEDKNKVKNRKVKKKRDGEFLEELSELETHLDGSVIPKEELFGWETFPWVCCDCHLTLANSEDLKDHYANIHDTLPKFSCMDCAKVYTKYSTFIAHVKVHRSKFKFNCDVCFKWFPSISAQERHRSYHFDERSHVCQTCGKRFRMQSALLVHARCHLPAEIKNRYECDQCPKRFGTKPNLMAHKRIHAGVRDYTCDQCGKSFVQKGNLDNHLLTHTAARPFSCSTCGKAFKTLVRLRKHSTVHSGLKPHQCDICGRQFRERGTLKEHHRIHTGAMPFTCEFCGKSFRFKGVLTTHRRQHTGERPYSCFECQHHFTNWPNYNKHMKRRHGINTSVTVRKPQTIPPTGMPHRNPPGTVLAPPQPVAVADTFVEVPTTFYPVLSLYNLSEELLQQRV